MKIPFLNYDLRISKRGVNVLDEDGQLIGLADWMNGFSYTRTTPIMEQIYSTIANEFAKLDFRHVLFDKKTYTVQKTNLNYALSIRPNPLQSAHDFKYTIAYQLLKYGNFIAYIVRDEKGHPVEINPIDVADYEMGCGYKTDEDTIWIKFKNKRKNKIELIEYCNIVHLRLNPNDIFRGDKCSSLNNSKVIIDIMDASLNSLLRELKDSGSVRGIVTLGNSTAGGGFSGALSNNTNKTAKQTEIISRIKSTKGGILVLDQGESWTSLSTPFKTISTNEINEYIDYLYAFSGINSKIIDGTAGYEEMEVFFNKIIVPIIERFISEGQYKFFDRKAIETGHRVEYYRNPFEYIPIDKAVNIAYKGAMDTTTNERRRMIYKMPPIDGGDELMSNKNFERLKEKNKDDKD
ncbi:MAG: phage portal protein [Erysipelotrichaceae bacterium]